MTPKVVCAVATALMLLTVPEAYASPLAQAAGYGTLDISSRVGDLEVSGKSELLARSAPLQTRLSGQTWSYTASVERTRMEDRFGILPPAYIHSYAYTALSDASDRPVMFAFNGGPGSSSIWNHIGGWGPKRIDVPGAPDIYAPPPWPVRDNPGFLIDVADIVFVDPVDTGLSRVADRGDPSAFFGIRNDARSMCIFVRNWLDNHGRTDASVFLSGNSYASVRVSAMLVHPGCMDLRPRIEGLILISGILDLENWHPGRSRAGIAAAGYFPTFAAIAWYHGLIDTSRWQGDMGAFLTEAEHFALNKLAPGLLKGIQMSGVELRDLAKGMTRFLGLENSGSIFLSASRIGQAFPDRMYDQAGKRPAQYDGRFAEAGKRSRIGILPPITFREIGAVYLSTLSNQIFNITGYRLGNGYIWLTPHGNWDYSFFGSQDDSAANMAGELVRVIEKDRASPGAAISLHPDFRLLAASGLYDSITPYFAVQLALQQAQVPEDVYEIYLYKAGHMPYLDPDVAPELDRKMREFITR